jgi:hypothetical protein
MIKKFTITLFFIITFFTTTTYAAASIAQIQAVLAKPNVVCGRFDQSKQLVGIAKPLKSNGRFCVVAGKSVLWQTLQPFPNTLRLTPDAIVQMQGGKVVSRLDAQQEPVVRMINNVLFSVLAGNLDQLNKLFDLNGTIRNKQWQVTLHAHDVNLAKALGDINLQGNNYVRKVVMQEANGDRTEITFSAMQQKEVPLDR